MLRLFDCLETDPNTLFQDSFRRGADVLTERERQLLEQYRSLSPLGRESVQTMVEALRACQQESAAPEQEPRVIPLYRTPAAAGYAAPVFGEDFDYLQVTDGVPQAAEFAVRIQGDSMVPYIPDGSVVIMKKYTIPPIPKPGTIVQYHDERGVTLKKLVRRKNPETGKMEYTLHPINPNFGDIEPMDGGKISGIYVETLERWKKA